MRKMMNAIKRAATWYTKQFEATYKPLLDCGISPFM